MGDTLNGELSYVFLVSILDAAILSWIALRWYRRLVLRFMQAPALAALSDPPFVSSAVPAADAGQPLLELEGGEAPPTGLRLSALPPGWKRPAAAYFAGALAYSLIVTVAMTFELWPVPEAAVASLLWVHTWPVVPIVAALLTLRWRQTLTLVAVFVGAGSAFVALVTLAGQTARGAFNSAPLTNVYWANAQLAVTAWLPLAVLLIIRRRRIRAVFAVTLAATLFFGATLLGLRRGFVEMLDVASVRPALLSVAAATSSEVAYYGIYMLMAVPVGWLVWRVLRSLAAAFERKAFSDVQLMVDCWVAIVTMETIATHLAAPFGLAGMAIGAAAFAAYRTAVEIVLRLWPGTEPGRQSREPQRLLLLRVFGHQSRTERLFDYIAQRWRFVGPVQLIAGGDLAMRTVDPGDVLAFVGGRLRNQYVASTDEVLTRIERLDVQADPDGRFRTNELYCLHDTWKAMLQSLLAVTDVVVMDVRGFSQKSRGVLYELHQIVTTIATDRIVLITDRGVDRRLLEETVAHAWGMSDPRPMVARHPIATVQVNRNASRELDAAMLRLLRIVEPQQEARIR